MKGYIKKILIKKGWGEDQLWGIYVISHFFFSINFFKTIYVNFKALPLRQAFKLPIIVSYNVKIRKLGDIKIISNYITPGMISLGVFRIESLETTKNQTIFTNKGQMIFSGRTKIHPGAKIVVNKNAVLKMGDKLSIGSNTKLFCAKKITIGNNFRISWNSQLFDTDFHFFSNIDSGKIYRRLKPVVIGNDVFVGNGSTIGKGTVIPNGSTISCCSKVVSDLTEYGENLLIMGNPAKVVSKGYIMLTSGWTSKKEAEIALKMNE